MFRPWEEDWVQDSVEAGLIGTIGAEIAVLILTIFVLKALPNWDEYLTDKNKYEADKQELSWTNHWKLSFGRAYKMLKTYYK